jgi:hypothetical protein
MPWNRASKDRLPDLRKRVSTAWYVLLKVNFLYHHVKLSSVFPCSVCEIRMRLSWIHNDDLLYPCFSYATSRRVSNPGSENSILDVCNGCGTIHHFAVLTLALFDIAVHNENLLFPVSNKHLIKRMLKPKNYGVTQESGNQDVCTCHDSPKGTSCRSDFPIDKAGVASRETVGLTWAAVRSRHLGSTTTITLTLIVETLDSGGRVRS